MDVSRDTVSQNSLNKETLCPGFHPWLCGSPVKAISGVQPLGLILFKRKPASPAAQRESPRLSSPPPLVWILRGLKSSCSCAPLRTCEETHWRQNQRKINKSIKGMELCWANQRLPKRHNVKHRAARTSHPLSSPYSSLPLFNTLPLLSPHSSLSFLSSLLSPLHTPLSPFSSLLSPLTFLTPL